jgi:hypothetical protein
MEICCKSSARLYDTDQFSTDRLVAQDLSHNYDEDAIDKSHKDVTDYEYDDPTNRMIVDSDLDLDPVSPIKPGTNNTSKYDFYLKSLKPPSISHNDIIREVPYTEKPSTPIGVLCASICVSPSSFTIDKNCEEKTEVSYEERVRKAVAKFRTSTVPLKKGEYQPSQLLCMNRNPGFDLSESNTESFPLRPMSNNNSPRRMGRRNRNASCTSLDKITSCTKFQRRMSTRCSAPASLNYRKRLGIRRSMDLSGEELEMYQKSNHTTAGDPHDIADDLKASVVLETILTAADVAHNLQGWDQMLKWSGRLYLELRRAYVQGKGTDPQPRWYENQIGFLESYLLPLARRLEDTGVFGPDIAPMFATIVELNRNKWLLHGIEVTKDIIAQGEQSSFLNAQIYPSTVEPKRNVRQAVKRENVMNSEANNNLQQRNVIVSSLVVVVILLIIGTRFHYSHTTLLGRGTTLPPGAWLDKCGLMEYVPGWCDTNVQLSIRSDGTVRYYINRGTKEIAAIYGTKCKSDTGKLSGGTCRDGLHLSEDGKLLVGGKHVTEIFVHKQYEHLVYQWPFEERQKLKIVRK